jgi:hypothetical protein
MDLWHQRPDAQSCRAGTSLAHDQHHCYLTRFYSVARRRVVGVAMSGARRASAHLDPRLSDCVGNISVRHLESAAARGSVRTWRSSGLWPALAGAMSRRCCRRTEKREPFRLNRNVRRDSPGCPSALPFDEYQSCSLTAASAPAGWRRPGAGKLNRRRSLPTREMYRRSRIRFAPGSTAFARVSSSPDNCLALRSVAQNSLMTWA